MRVKYWVLQEHPNRKERQVLSAVNDELQASTTCESNKLYLFIYFTLLIGFFHLSDNG